MYAELSKEKKDELVSEINTQKKKYRGFVMELSHETDLNYYNLCSIAYGKRDFGYKAYYRIKKALPKVIRIFEAKQKKK